MNCNILCPSHRAAHVDKDNWLGSAATGNGSRHGPGEVVAVARIIAFCGARVASGDRHSSLESGASVAARGEPESPSRPCPARPQINTEKFKFPFDIKVQICRMRVSPKGVVSSAGRAPALQAGGQRFDPVTTHHYFRRASSRSGSSVG